MTMKRGIALLAVLWIITGAAIVAAGVMLLARDVTGAAINRIDLMRAEWGAEECLARAWSVLAERVGPFPSRAVRPADIPVESLPLLVARAPVVRGCPGTITLAPAGLGLDLTTIPGEVLRRALLGQRVDPAMADSMVAAFLDWRDADDVPRPMGCELICARAAFAAAPRNGPLADVNELRLIRGFARWDSLAVVAGSGSPLRRLFTIDGGRLALGFASAEVLAALPGLGVEGAQAIVRARAGRVGRIADLAAVGGLLAPAARDTFRSRYPELAAQVTVVPDAWLLTATSPAPDGGGGPPPNAVTIQLRAVLLVDGMRVVRRKVSP